EAYEAFACADEAEPLPPSCARRRCACSRETTRRSRASGGRIMSTSRGGRRPAPPTCAGWIGMTLFYNGAVGPAGGWLARVDGLPGDVPRGVGRARLRLVAGRVPPRGCGRPRGCG